MNRVQKTIRMRQSGDSLPSNNVREEKTDEIYPELSTKVSAPEKKLTLPNIQPTVIQALPSFQQALPSLQPTEKLSLPAIQPKVKKAPSRPKSSVKRILPNIPAMEELSLSGIKGNASASVQQLLPILPSIEKPDALLTETKVQPKVKSVVKRILPSIPTIEKLPPSIPTTEKISLPSIEPTAVKAQPKVRPRRRRRKLPCITFLPTIEEQISPVPEEADASGEVVPPAEQGKPQGDHPVEIVKSNVGSLAEDNVLQSRELQQKESTVSTPPAVVEPTKAALPQVEKEAEPSRKEELRESARPKRKVTVQKPTKKTKGTQTCLQPSEEVVPSLKPINRKHSENSGKKLERLFPGFPAESTKMNQPMDEELLSLAHPKETLPRGSPGAPLKKVLPGIKPMPNRSSPSRHPTVEKAVPRSPMNRRTKESLQMAETEALSSMQHAAGHKIPRPPAAREMKLTPQLTEREPLANVKGTTGPKPQTETGELLSPHRTLVERKFPRPPAGKRMLIPQKEGQTLEEVQRGTGSLTNEPLSPYHTFSERKIPRPPAAGEMKLSPQTSEGQTLEEVQRATGPEKQTETNEPLSPHHTLLERSIPRTPGEMKLSPQTSEGQTLASFQAITHSKSEAHLRLRRPVENTPSKPSTAPRQSKASPAVAKSEAMPSVQPRPRETPPNVEPKPGSYAFLNLKRREFEELQRLQLTAKRNRAKERQSRDILTVKPALPAIQSAKEDVASFKPHPPDPTVKKGLPSTRPNVKRQRSKWRTKADRQLPSLQPTVKQVLPSISSSNLDTLVKQPLPSVQPEENFTVREQADFQSMDSKRIPQYGNLRDNEM